MIEMHLHASLLWLLASACAPATYRCESEGGGPVDLDYTVTWPGEGTRLEGPWTPVVVPVESSERPDFLRMCLDGAPADDPVGILRRRAANHGGGWDYLGFLDLTGLDAGEHELEVVFPHGRRTPRGAKVSFTTEPPPHRVHLTVTDADGVPVSARVVVTNGFTLVPVVRIPVEADPSGRDIRVSSVFATDGTADLDLERGHYRLLVVRSILDDATAVEVDVDGDLSLEVQVPRVLSLPGTSMADLHVHTGRSYDSFLPDQLRWASLAAAGLDIAVVTDHNQIVQTETQLAEVLPAWSQLRTVTGIEHDINHPDRGDDHRWDLGHLNAFPLVGRTDLPPRDVDVIGEAVGSWRRHQHRHPHPETGEDVVVQLNHPRGIHFVPSANPNRQAWPLFEQVGFDRTVDVGVGTNAWMLEEDPRSGATAMDFDALEIVNRFSWSLYLEVRQDWFTLLDQGYFMTGTGNSDSHAMAVEVAGFPVNLVDLPPPSPGSSLDHRAFVDAIEQGRVGVSTGPVVTLEVDGVRPGGLVWAEGTVTAAIRVQAAPWVPVEEIRLVVGSDVVASWPGPERSDAPLDATFEVVLPITTDTWVVAEAGHPLATSIDEQPRITGDYGFIAPGYVPIGFTNPVRIDADSDGHWRP